MIPRQFDDVAKQDVDNLVADSRPERRTLEYKEAMPNLALDQDKAEFLADVSSFANASGGDILFGVVDKRENGKPTGIPERAPGVAVANPDAVIRQLEQSARSNIDPRIPGLQMKAIPGFPEGPVILTRVPKSYVGVHSVRQKDWMRFYSRGSTGKHLLDVAEVRSAFAISDALPERIRRFHAERVAAAEAGQTPLGDRPGPKVILHVLPLSSMNPLGRMDVLAAARGKIFMPLYSGGADTRYNFDGYLHYSCETDRSDVFSYTQLFRSGAVEAAERRLLSPRKDFGKLIPQRSLEDALLDALRTYLAALRGMGVGAPVFVLITLVGVRGYYIQHNHDARHPIDRDTLNLPEAVIEDFADLPEEKLRPTFDALWQAAGWSRSFNYDEQGKRKARSR